MTTRTPESDSNWLLRHSVAFVGILIMIVLVIVIGFQPNSNLHPFWIWLILLALFTALTLVISRALTRRWLGVVIDERNKYSLSRFQMVLWTVMILAAFMAAVLANVRLNLLVYVSGAVDPPQMLFVRSGALVSDVLSIAGVIVPNAETGIYSAVPGVDLSQLNLAEAVRDGQQIIVPRPGETLPLDVQARSEAGTTSNTTPLSVQIPSEVWLLLGISTTSLVASPLIKGQKTTSIVTNQSASEARFSDLFKGEEANNFAILDLGKVQLLYFTLIVIGAYMIAVANMFLNTQVAIASLPALDGGVVAMLGVSHAGYLTGKAVNRSGGVETTTEAAPAAAAPPEPPANEPGSAG